MPVNSTHQQYDDSVSKWKLVRDCVSGAKAVRDAGEEYLPHPDKNADDSGERYAAYKMRADYVNVVGRTKKAMVGMAFRKEPKRDIPSKLDYLIEDATGDNFGLDQLAKKTVGELLQVSRYGLLADYPVAEIGLTSEQVTTLNLRASIKTYPAESIINWKVEAAGSENVLSLVVLKEVYDEVVDDFKSKTKTQYRVLRLTGGIYTVEIWRDDKLFTEPAIPRGSDGSVFNVIPLIIAGADSNDPSVDEAALYDLAEINISHYRNSADYQEGIFLHGQPMLHLDIGETSAAAWSELNPNGVSVGARRGIITNGGGSMTLHQAQANTAASESIDKKEAQMLAIGARMIESGGVAQTAFEVSTKHASDNSVLTNVVQNTSKALITVLGWCGKFMGSDEVIEYSINEEFFDKTRTAQEVMADLALLDRNVIAVSDVRATLRKSGGIEPDRTDEDIDADVGDTDPTE